MELRGNLEAVTKGSARSSTQLTTILRATALLSGSSVVSILVGLVSAKAWAVLLGPTGLGFMGLLQALVGLVGLVAGAGVGTGVIRMGANALERGDHVRAAALQRAGWLLLWAAGGLAVLLMVGFRDLIGELMLGGREHAWDVVLMTLALVFSLASGLQVSLLNAHHRVKILAQYGILNSVVGAVLSLALVWVWRERGIALAVIVNAAVGWVISGYLLRRESPPTAEVLSRDAVLGAARDLLRFGAPYTASMLVGTGVQQLLPVLVLHALGAEGVGLYRGAVAISITYLGFLLSAMAMDYYPRISAASHRPGDLVELVNEQHRLVMLLAAPLILGMLALAPVIVPLIYSPQFAPSVQILEWQLIGDFLRFASWTMGFVILARGRSLTVFAVELVAGIDILLLSWLGILLFGLPGTGIAFLATYAVHYLVLWFIVRRDIKLSWTAANKAMLIGSLAAALSIQLLPQVGLGELRTPLALTLALLAGAVSLYIIWRELLHPLPTVHQDVGL